MRIHLPCLPALLALLFTIVPVAKTCAADTNKFIANIKADVSTVYDGKNVQIDNSITYVYRRVRDGREVEILLDGLKFINTTPTGIQKMVVTHDRYYSGERDKYIDMSLDKADPTTKEIMQDTYGTPLARFKLDQNDVETNVVLLGRSGAKKTLDSGLLDSIRNFHPSFYPQRETWTCRQTLPMGNGGNVQGSLTYQKMKNSEAHLTTVNISGSLTNVEFHPVSGPVHTNINYQFSGTQTYDSLLHEWVGANFTIQISIDLLRGKRIQGSTTGTLHATLEKVPLAYELEVK